MYKVVIAAALAAGLVASPLPRLTKPAAVQTEPAKTQANTEAKAKPKKEPSADIAAMRARQTKCAAEWKKRRRPPARSRRE